MEKILILDFGSQYTKLIAKKCRYLNIYCEICPYNKFCSDLENVKGVILSGSPCSVSDIDAPYLDIKKINIPILGICYGSQIIAKNYGLKIENNNSREYGLCLVKTVKTDKILDKIPTNINVWMSHSDSINIDPKRDDFILIAKTLNINTAIYKIKNKNIYGVQFHPEVTHTEYGDILFNNFLIGICGCNNTIWTPENIVLNISETIRKKIKDDKVIMAVSGGVDSTVTAMLLNRVIGKNLYCVYINNGFMRKDEHIEISSYFKTLGIHLDIINSSDIFIKRLNNISDPETKRKIIGKTFIDEFVKHVEYLKLRHHISISWLGQGTIYSDVIESVSIKGISNTIKSHHNVGGLPEYLPFRLIEPIRELFKDEVRNIGRELKIPDDILLKHPFPGPGMSIRIIGTIKSEYIEILRQVDHIFINELKKRNLYYKIWQAGAIFLPIQSVGVMGDKRTYNYVIALRAVVSRDGMTANCYPFDINVISEIASIIINKVEKINRVVYDITSKPPATIEWE